MHQFHEHVEYIQHMHICIYDACMQMAVWDVGLQWAQMFKNLWPKLSVQNRQGGAAANKHAGKLWCWKLSQSTISTARPLTHKDSMVISHGGTLLLWLVALWLLAMELCLTPPQISFSQMSSPPALLQDNGNYSFFTILTETFGRWNSGWIFSQTLFGQGLDGFLFKAPVLYSIILLCWVNQIL